MSNPEFFASDQHASNKRFLEELREGGNSRRIKRKSRQARITHGATVICCLWLVLSGLFVFIPALTQLAGPGVVFFMRMSHRVIGVLFVLIPLVSAVLAPKGVKHIFKNLFDKWDGDDKKWMALFMPYLFSAKHLHMPDQHEVKSGQRFADGMLWLFGAVMGVTGLILLLGTTVFDLPAGAYSVVLLLHDIGFFFIAIFGMAHIFLGSGLFQPYRGSGNIMWGDGTVSESDALYHWGHWAREEIESGKNVVEERG